MRFVRGNTSSLHIGKGFSVSGTNSLVFQNIAWGNLDGNFSISSSSKGARTISATNNFTGFDPFANIQY